MSAPSTTKDAYSNNEKEALRLLRELGGGQVQEDQVKYQGTELIVPKSFEGNLTGLIKFLTRLRDSEEETTEFSRIFKFRPWDGAFALNKTLRDVFGTGGIGMATRSFFGTNPPEMRTIEIGVNETASIPWGIIEFPPLSAVLSTDGIPDSRYGLLFRLSVTTLRKYKAEVEGLFKALQDTLEKHSIYKGKAITGGIEPAFLDPYKVDRTKVVYSTTVQERLEAEVWGGLRYTDAYDRNGIPLKWAVLLEGPYGTGKSLAAMITAQEAVENGWTFIQCRAGEDNLQHVLQTAQLYQPAVVFYEDVDTLARTGDPEKVAALLDMFDGIQTKGTKLLAVLTSNHVEAIHKGMLRPGRLDGVINIEGLDPAGLVRLIRATIPTRMLAAELDEQAIGESMDGFLPAFAREAMNRAIRYALQRTEGVDTGVVLETQDFVKAAHALRPQLDLMNVAQEGEQPDALSQTLAELINNQVVGKRLTQRGQVVGVLEAADKN